MNSVHLAVDQRYRAPGLLIFGASCAVLGFLLITVIGGIEFKLLTTNRDLKVKYDSGHGYWPSTVSEMVHDHGSPGGKLFYTFGLIAGVCIFASQYPFHLRNVYTGDETVLNTSIYWTTFRQIVPSMGLWLLIGVNTYPTTIALNSVGLLKMFCVFLHLLGAGMMFVGYMFCELKCLGLLGFRLHHPLAIEKTERRVRVFLAWTILLGFFLFCAMQVLLNVAKKLDICCGDKWALKGQSVKDTRGHRHFLTSPEIIDTAKGWFLIIKIASFVFEDVAGLALVFSHIAVWYFSEERHVKYGEVRLREIYKQDDP
uniref:Uncharacterized protein n=1 Tax=Alexandrium andersonii TaxID=327968 RepID=A0A7S2HUB7_9DINO